MGLDGVGRGRECRAGADVGDGREPSRVDDRLRDVDSVLRDELVPRIQVGGGEAEPGAARLAVDHRSLDDVRAPEKLARQLHLPRLNGAPDAAAADRAVEIAHLLHLRRADSQFPAGPDDRLVAEVQTVEIADRRDRDAEVRAQSLDVVEDLHAAAHRRDRTAIILRAQLAYTPAIRSSTTMPQPPGSPSA